MKIYAIEFAKSALKELRKLDAVQQRRIIRSIDTLKDNPRKGNVRPMVGVDSWRLRVGSYRVIYDIKDDTLVITVVRIRHRKDAYRH